MMLPKSNHRQAAAQMASLATPLHASTLLSPAPSRTRNSRRRRLLPTHPLVLLSVLALTLVLHPASLLCSAERDFNFNDSQVPMLEPKDEPLSGAAVTTTLMAKESLLMPQQQDPYAMELSQCRRRDNELVLSLVLKSHNWHELGEARRHKVLDKLSQFFAIPKEFVTMESVTKREMTEMQKASLVAGKNKCHTTTAAANGNRKLGRVNFVIGCHSDYFKMAKPLVNQIGQQMKDGAIDNITGEKFGLWIIWAKQHKSRTHRTRRQIDGSGLTDDDFDDDYEYEDDEDIVEEPTPNVASTANTNNLDANSNSNIGNTNNNNNDNDNDNLNGLNNEVPEDEEYYDTPLDEDEEEDTNSNTTSSTSTTAQTVDDISASSSSTQSSGSPYAPQASPTTTPVSTSSIGTSSSTTTTASTTTLATTTELPATTTTTTSTTTTTAIPDYIEPKLENSPPMIKTRLQKMAVTSGKAFRFTIPEETFIDTEDMSNLRLDLTDKEGRELKMNSWLQFNAETKEVYGLPLDDAVSKWQYRLTATDSGNESVTETLEISVQQHRGVRTVNHEINIAVKINEKNMHYIDWQMSLIKAIATTLNDDNTNSIVVREIRQNPQDPNSATLVYFNETLPTSECPENELNSLIKRLDAQRLNDLVQPTLGIKSITGQLIGSCQKSVTAGPKPTLVKNSPPMPRNQVDRVVATAGHLLVYKVPSDTFFDPNGDKLVLSLKTKDHKELSPRHWLQFDSKNEEFYGIPKTGDIGFEEYMLVAEDAGGLTATDALVVTVNHAPKREFSVYFKAYLGIRHAQFNADLQRKFVERIAQLFGDASTQNIQIRSINVMHEPDGTTVNFYNTTLFKSHNRCPEDEMEAVRNVYLNDNVMRDRVRKALGPELNITNLQVHQYDCSSHSDVMRPDFVPNKTDEPLLKSNFSDDYLYTIILPAVIIVTMILVASIIACCLHRRRRKSGKMELGDEEERKSFRTKGIPVIFQDELEDKPEIGNKSPIILKDEKPPLLPPSYNTSNMNGDNDVDEYVPPPAVIVDGREARGKSPATPSYRKPPPYVSP